jgi:ParB/RepB/Spo0J family partition protein
MESNALEAKLMEKELPILQWLKVTDIRVPEKRLRSKLCDFKAKIFKSSIEDVGVLQPIQVVEDEEGNKWLADGQNRLESWMEVGHGVIPALVRRGTKIEAVIASAKYNMMRGKINPGELAEFVAYLHNGLGLSYEKISAELHISTGYISKLVTIAENSDVVEKVKNGQISVKEAYNEVLSFTVKPISTEKAHFTETSPKQEATAKASAAESMKNQAERQEFMPVTDEDWAKLRVTTSLKQAMKENKSFKLLGPEEEEEERRGRCAYCGGYFTSKNEIAFIVVHKRGCKRKVWDLIMEAEREARNESPQSER